jgi:hypothetical protein
MFWGAVERCRLITIWIMVVGDQKIFSRLKGIAVV